MKKFAAQWFEPTTLSYGALHSRIHETVKIIQLQAHTKFKIHNYIFSCMQKLRSSNPRVASLSPVLVIVFSYVNGIFSWFYNVCQDRCKNGTDYTNHTHCKICQGNSYHVSLKILLYRNYHYIENLLYWSLKIGYPGNLIIL